MVLVSSILITSSLVFYSIGVWAERWVRYLKVWHVVSFWLGFAFDVSGSYAMHLISEGDFNILEPHTLTGQIALWMMLIHALWATRVTAQNNKVLRTKFHHYSMFVWFLWLIPYFGGMYLGMTN